METKDEHFEDQLNHIDDLSTKSLDVDSPDQPGQKKLTKKQTKSAVDQAIESGEITFQNGQEILKHLGMLGGSKNNKKVISKQKKKVKRKMQAASRKLNRK